MGKRWIGMGIIFVLMCMSVMPANVCAKETELDRGVSVMCVGESTTYGNGTVSGFRGPLWRLYQQAGIQVNFVGPNAEKNDDLPLGSGHAGYGGYYIREIADRIDPWLESYKPPFADGLRGEGKEGDICLLVRSAWLGSQRHGALLWSGDVPSTFDSLRRQVKVGLNAGMSGIPWWNSDVGGFQYGNPFDPVFQELLARWFQFGVFCHVLRLHGDRVWDVQPPVNNELLEHTGADNELWSFGEEIYQI